MAGYNRVVLVGNLTRDPEYKQLTSGQSVCRLGLATNRQYKNRQSGEMVQEVCFIDIDVWGAQADSCHQYLQKGRSILVEGRLKLDTWEDPSGQNRSKHSVVADRVVFLSSAGEGDTASSTTSSFSSPRSSEPVKAATKPKQEAAMPAPESALEKELFDQIESIKKKNQSKELKAKADKPAVEFKDQPPFEDELPF
jgi:single-strand DNA-binding protein